MAYFAARYFASWYWAADSWNVTSASGPSDYFGNRYFGSPYYGPHYWGGEEQAVAEAGAVRQSDGGSGRKRRRIPPIRLADGRLYYPQTWEEFLRLLAAIKRRTGQPPVVVPPTKPREVPIVLASPPDADWRPIEDVVAELERLAEELEEDDTITLLMAA